MQRSELWQRIRAARKRAQKYQWQIADALGIDKSAVTQWESKNPARRTRPDISRLEKLAQLTSTPMWWFLSDDVNVEEPWPWVDDEAHRASPPDQSLSQQLHDFWSAARHECRRRRSDLWSGHIWTPEVEDWERPLVPFARTERAAISVLSRARPLWADVVADVAKLIIYADMTGTPRTRLAYLVWKPITNDIDTTYLPYLDNLNRLRDRANIFSDRVGVPYIQVQTPNEAAEYLSQIL